MISDVIVILFARILLQIPLLLSAVFEKGLELNTEKYESFYELLMPFFVTSSS